MIHWQNVSIKNHRQLLLQAVNIDVSKGEAIGVIGRNSSGKSTLAKAIAGKINCYPSMANSLINSVEFVDFQSTFEFKHGVSAYRQQRWNSPDPEVIPTVKAVFETIENQALLVDLVAKFNFESHLNKMVISLSNGEQRKFEIIKALTKQPDILIIDNAFTGLDVESRKLVAELFTTLISEGQTLILTAIDKSELPKSVQKLYWVQGGTVQHIETDPIENIRSKPLNFNYVRNETMPYETIFSLNNIVLQYDDKFILKNVSWTVKKSEKWILSGENGAGKTSLLNLVFGDNPKAYLMNIELFGKPKGSGETIWDIKKKIGYISPEMQQYLNGNQTVLEVLCSGFFDSEGLYQKSAGYVEVLAKNWLKNIHLEHLSKRKLKTLSTSEQRIVLIVRSLIKLPPLLILDEPFQGLDSENRIKMQQLISEIGRKSETAMIFVTHYREQIPEIFDLELRLAVGGVIHKGKKIE